MGNTFLTHGKEIVFFVKQWKVVLLLVLFDVLLLLGLFAGATLFDFIMALHETALVGTWLGYLFLLAYFLLVMGVYSFFTYCCLGFLTKEKKEKGVTFQRFWTFYLWNCMLYGISFLIFGVFFLFFAYGLVSFLKNPGLLIFGIAYWTIFYLYMQTSHVLFFVEKKILLKELAKKVWTTLQWNWLWKWGVWNVLFLVVLTLLYFGLFLIMMLIGRNSTNYELFYVFNVIILLFLIISTYFLFFWNRLSVLVFVRNSVKK